MHLTLILFSRVLLAIILLLCCFIYITLRFYFDERKKAKTNESRASAWRSRYDDMLESRNMYLDEDVKAKSRVCELEDAIKHKDSEIKLLKQQVDNRTINYIRTTVVAEDVSSNILIPRDIFKDEDPVESSLFYAAAWNTLVNLIAKDILSDSTRFNIEYDMRNDVYRLCYHYKKFLSRDYRSDGYRIEPWSKSPVEELVERIRKQEGEKDGNKNN